MDQLAPAAEEWNWPSISIYQKSADVIIVNI